MMSYACSIDDQNTIMRNTVNDYYKVYQERSDFEKFLSFYDDDIAFEDIILGEKVRGKSDFTNFFDWSNPSFAKTDSLALLITDQVIDKNQVVTKGYFTPFIWGDSLFEAMHFTTLLTFNQKGKIQKQVDWINYPNNLVDYHKRKNANDWLLK